MCVNSMHRLILPIPMSVPDGNALAIPMAIPMAVSMAVPVAAPMAFSVAASMSVGHVCLMSVLHS